MSLKDFEYEVVSRMLAFLWRHWTGLGVAGSGAGVADGMVVDPEALLLASLDFARRDARLFDEILDWLLVNGDVLNVARLHTLAASHKFPMAARVLPAVSRVVSRQPSMRMRWKAKLPQGGVGTPEPFFLDVSGAPLPPPRDLDADFLEFGWIRGPVRLRGLSTSFPTRTSATLLLQLRSLFGMSSRCELICLMATRPSVSSAEAALIGGYTSRTVQATLAEMTRSGFVTCWNHGRQIRYALRRDVLAGLLPNATLVFPPAAALLSAVGTIAAALAACVRKETPDEVAVVLIRRELQPLADRLTLAGVEGMPLESTQSPTEEFLATLGADVRRLIGLLEAAHGGVPESRSETAH